MPQNYQSDSYCVVTNDQATIRNISEFKKVQNYITNEFSANVSLSVINAIEVESDEKTEYDRIYYVLEGEMTIFIKEKEFGLKVNDSIFIKSSTEYTMKGTFKSIVINQPAFGSI